MTLFSSEKVNRSVSVPILKSRMLCSSEQGGKVSGCSYAEFGVEFEIFLIVSSCCFLHYIENTIT